MEKFPKSLFLVQMFVATDEFVKRTHDSFNKTLILKPMKSSSEESQIRSKENYNEAVAAVSYASLPIDMVRNQHNPIVECMFHLVPGYDTGLSVFQLARLEGAWEYHENLYIIKHPNEFTIGEVRRAQKTWQQA